MKCPHCEYQYGWNWINDEYKKSEGDLGDFYSLSNSIQMTRSRAYYPDETAAVYACPSCGKLFIEV